MLGQGLNIVRHGKTFLKKSVYDDLQQKDLQRIIQERDRRIRKLQYKIQKLQKNKQQMIKVNFTGSSQNDRMLYFKEKIGQQMKSNQKAISLFIQTKYRITKIIQLLQTPSDLSEDMSEMKGLIDILQPGVNSSNYSNDSISQSQISQNINDLEIDFNKVLDDLQVYTSQFKNAFITLQKHYVGLEKKIRQQKKIIDQKQISYESEVKQQRSKKENFKKLLEKAQTQKNDLINNIANICSQQNQKELEKMDRKGYLDFIKKMFYRIKDLQNQKKNYLKNFNRDKEMTMQKYKKILLQVKQVKEREGGSRMNQSVS